MSHHQEASRHKSNLPFLHESHNSYPHTQTNFGVFQEHQTINVTDLPAESSLPPTTSLSSRAFSGSNFIDFEISFKQIKTKGIRIIGLGGGIPKDAGNAHLGMQYYSTISELRVYSE